MYPVTVYGTPDGAVCSTGNETTVYFFPLTLCGVTVALAALEASFKKPGGERATSSFAFQPAFAAITVVFCASATGASPPPPASCPSGSAGRERRAVC